ncbi:hypothetical protein [Melittangium boletus]|nr:hypothetical protein [Melittangium boletus]
MMRKWLGVGGVIVGVVAAWACGGAMQEGSGALESVPTPPGEVPEEDEDASLPPPDAGIALPDPGASDDAGIPDDGGGDTGAGGGADAGTQTDAGTDAGDEELPGGGSVHGVDLWPQEAVVDYTQRFGVGRPQGVAVDDAFNLWLLDGRRIGVIRSGETQPTWASNIGQAGRGFSSTVICGGAAGRAYVGYYAKELDNPEHQSAGDPAYGDGDLDAVRLTPEGIKLEEHLTRSFRRGKDGSLTWNPPGNTGLHNSNDWHFDEDRAVLGCAKVMRGRDRGDVYVSTNHGVTRVNGLNYNSHRHPTWFDDQGHQHIGYSYAVGIAQDGDVLIGTDWTFGIVTPNKDMGVWDWMDPKSLNPMKVESSYLPQLNSLAEFDFWRAFQQTRDGRYYLASASFGLWEMTVVSAKDRGQRGTRVPGLPTDRLTSLAATDEGSLFIGTSGGGLWRLDANKRLFRVTDVAGNTVKQLVYDPSTSPAMLYVLTDQGLTVLRGY